MGENRAYRNRMRDECVKVHATLIARREMQLCDLADEIGASVDTARRWVNSFGLVMPVEIRRGRIFVGVGII